MNDHAVDRHPPRRLVDRPAGRAARYRPRSCDAPGTGRSSVLPTAEDAWGRPVLDRETADDEAERLLMPLNWLCDLLERMRSAPEAAAGTDGVAFSELMRRLQDSSRSTFVRDHLDLAASRAEAGCYDDAIKALRSLTT